MLADDEADAFQAGVFRNFHLRQAGLALPRFVHLDHLGELAAAFRSRRRSSDLSSARERGRGRLLAAPTTGVLLGERFSYRSIRGSPKCGKALLPPNQVIAEICWPSRVTTIIPYSRAISVWGGGK